MGNSNKADEVNTAGDNKGESTIHIGKNDKIQMAGLIYKNEGVQTYFKEVHKEKDNTVSVNSTTNTLVISKTDANKHSNFTQTLTIDHTLAEKMEDALKAAFNDGEMSGKERRRFKKLSDYIATHAEDGILDTKEVGKAIAKANHVASRKSNGIE